MSFIDTHHGELGIEPICRELAVAPSSWHEHAARLADPGKRSARARRDDEIRQEIGRGQGLRTLAAPLGGRAHPSLAESQPPSRQGLRADHRLGHRMVLHCFRPASHQTYRKIMKLRRLILNQTLSHAIPAEIGDGDYPALFNRFVQTRPCRS